MTLQVLVSAMNTSPRELIGKMNIDTDCIIVNQCDRYDHEKFSTDGHEVQCFSMAERGVGLSRNHALLRADHDISLFSDEDIVYEDDCEKKVLEAFEQHPEADILLFNVEVCPERKTYFNTACGRVRWFNCGRYPAYSIAARTEKLKKNRLVFSLLFGGGARYSAGEDSLFLRDCLRRGLKIYKIPVLLGKETPGESTWFRGFTEKFFFDRGALYYFLYGPLKHLMALRFVLSKRKEMCREISWRKAYVLMKKGMREAAE